VVTYRVEIERVAVKALQRLPQADRTRILGRIRGLTEDPYPAGATKLVGANGFRIRSGDYRIVYVVDETDKIVTVTRIGHRREVYR